MIHTARVPQLLNWNTRLTWKVCVPAATGQEEGKPAEAIVLEISAFPEAKAGQSGRALSMKEVKLSHFKCIR